jgi:hypothetical protein
MAIHLVEKRAIRTSGWNGCCRSETEGWLVYGTRPKVCTLACYAHKGSLLRKADYSSRCQRTIVSDGCSPTMFHSAGFANPMRSRRPPCFSPPRMQGTSQEQSCLDFVVHVASFHGCDPCDGRSFESSLIGGITIRKMARLRRGRRSSEP